MYCLYCRFDKFNLKYNPFGQSRLREIFIKQVGGRGVEWGGVGWGGVAWEWVCGSRRPACLPLRPPALPLPFLLGTLLCPASQPHRRAALILPRP